MRIESSDIHMNARSTDSERQSQRVSVKQEKVTVIGLAVNQQESDGSGTLTAKDALKEYRRRMEALKPAQPIEIEPEEIQQITVIEKLISMLLGKEFRFHRPYLNDMEPSAYGSSIQGIVGGSQWDHQVIETSIEYHRESGIRFDAQGMVQTEDGRQINIDLHLSKQRSLSVTMTSRQETWTKPKDPLVLQFDGAFPELSGETMSFDIDFDGTEDQIHQLTSGSGFLVYDKNEDGIIHDGSELFGTRTGDGFSELSAYDIDENGWIDENDPIFNKLRIWMGDEQGGRTLIGLGEVGVGAIYVGHLSTYFEEMDSAYNKLGAIQQSGIYLREDGQVSSIHHLDFYV